MKQNTQQSGERSNTYPSHAESSKDTPRDAARDAAVLDLRGPRVGVHLGELQHGAVADGLRQRCVADHVPERLSGSRGEEVRLVGVGVMKFGRVERGDGMRSRCFSDRASEGWEGECGKVPLRFMLFEDLALRVVPDDSDVDEAAQVELLRSEDGVGHCCRCAVSCCEEG